MIITNPKTILITGGAGYIGSHIGFLLAQQGYQIIVLDTFLHQQQFNPAWATIIRADFADQETLHYIFQTYKPEAVVHCAALIEVGESVKNPAHFYETNVGKVIDFLSVMLMYEVRTFIFSSSCAVYGNPTYLPLDENHPRLPVSPYGRTKMMVEDILKDYAQAYGIRFAALRYFNAVGAVPTEGLGEQHSPETHLIPLLLRALLDHKPFKVFGTDYKTTDGTCMRDYVHVLDIAQAHVLALQYLQAGGVSDFFNLGTGTGYTVLEIIREAERVCGKQAQLIFHERRAGDAEILVAQQKKVEQVLGWKPQQSTLPQILRDAYVWECEQRKKREIGKTFAFS